MPHETDSSPDVSDLPADSAAITGPAGSDVAPVVASHAPALGPGSACPFLIAAGGAYRMSIPDREHRCAAFVPATSLAVTKQARLCLTPNHAGCATYIASTSARQARVGAGERLERAGRWGLARTMPIVEEVGGFRATIGALLADRRTWPAIPAALLATLLLALGLSGSWGGGAVTALASATPSPRGHASSAPTDAPTASPGSEPSVVPSEPATPAPTAEPTPVASTVAYTTYKVKSGDTLYVIAQKFHTTVKAIQELNGLTSTSLHIGQVLKIPTS